MSIKVGVVGAGSVGSTLGGMALKGGNSVKYASRDPSSDKIKELLSSQAGTSADTTPNVVSWADVIILATPGAYEDEGITKLAESLGDVTGKVIIDVTNPLSAFPGLEVRWKQGTSGAEVLQAALPNAIIYKAFNTLGVENMSHGDGSGFAGWTGGQLSMMYAGGPEKNDQVATLIKAMGWIPAYVGPIRYARNLEAIAELWIHLGVPPAGTTSVFWGRNFVFEPIGASIPE
ncbi:hypothetical protein JKP88DRAFT_202007 [Tribonema minus]|uniref:Pyrroline-5-carboxylate reductase catalytic N-terminal domain-containing protein n=1 Tax=Tribonema minus TaxID=303371 RepID=A0A835YWW1_9STRA|nr:hypothetical protein JKP88DRAFT_202007 [Tribonema minus]